MTTPPSRYAADDTGRRGAALPLSETYAWVHALPDGAVSLDVEDATLVLHASQSCQERFEALLACRQAGTLSPEATRAYEAMCALDAVLSWLNRLTRGTGPQGDTYEPPCRIL